MENTRAEVEKRNMALTNFAVPIDTRLIRYKNELLKFKVLFEDIDNLPTTYSEEIETVIKAYVHEQNRGNLKNVQSKNLLFDISTKSWKASKELKFKFKEKELKTYTKEIHFKVQCKGKSHQEELDQHEETETDQEGVRLNRFKKKHLEIGSDGSTSKAGPSKEKNLKKRMCTTNKDVEAVSIKVPRQLDPNIYKAKVNLGKPVDKDTCCVDTENLNSNNNNISSHCIHTTNYENLNSAYCNANTIAPSKKLEHVPPVTSNNSICQFSVGSSRIKRKLYPLGVSGKTIESEESDNVLAYLKDRAIIHQEDLEEEMKFQELASALPTTQKAESEIQSVKRSSLFAAAWEVLVSPVKYFLRSKKNNST